ncbi:hypothetical protein CcaverHIS002_0308370 [Cutaneotrichosporon cavernicola]|uniref:Uncharacterized protein n=1 Tax=Cutaneotrichosporon cavernicola TaxID=279322 RepID=A0AA48KZP3_9TREE|nr:uncharacterized protein CcaverHIS019_0308240 [Cutaneotrichosporon cavernicola]BEI82969.1 hypothetical protein CcaverHIS002_0308370 [Cutaneotrichosporon cavernicola]BEI90754.1 hypothetical protein CcaverHIS019_0308240 [Cutaneotrichosporon cavernicola]BEI98534.1 hypothetical protein CcaverHIS631_0308330 [Cutaneotrichosporon cavernicola]BEJ06305.1 hypothetical protein CcaverHIS641_0308270 [Cutaneotrichosporon cavernicola]
MPAAVATVPTLNLLSMNASPTVLASARAAAGSRHGLINATRLVHSLAQNREEGTWLQTVLYARALLDALRGGNEGASTTADALDDLEGMLSRAEDAVQASAKKARAPAPTVALPLLDLPSAPAEVALLDEAVPAKLDEGDVEALTSPPPLPPSPAKAREPSHSPSILLSPSGGELDTASYFAKRRREDETGGEAGLLPLKTAKVDEGMSAEGMRRRLLGTGGAQSAVGSAALHEELGGQLADMSHRLKLNAIHFSNSLEEEKGMLQHSEDTLESNLTATKESKGTLSKVSTKGRSTTCMTIGVIIAVILLFVWTLMLIRFT